MASVPARKCCRSRWIAARLWPSSLIRSMEEEEGWEREEDKLYLM